jgi:hypothetical protein
VRRGRLLHYYADEHRDQLRGLIDLTKIKSISLSPKTSPPSPEYEVFKVVLKKPNPKWTFAAPIGQARGWMRRIAVMKEAAIATRKPEILRQGWLEKRGRFSSIRERYCCICRCSMRPPSNKGALKITGVSSKLHLNKPSLKGGGKHGAAELAAGMDPDMEDLMMLFYMDKDLAELTGGIDLKSIVSAEVTAPEDYDDASTAGRSTRGKAGYTLDEEEGNRGGDERGEGGDPAAAGGGRNSMRSVMRWATSGSTGEKRPPMQMFRLFAQERVYAFAAPLEEEGGGENSTGGQGKLQSVQEAEGRGVAEAWVECIKEVTPWLEVAIWDRTRSTVSSRGISMARTATRTATISMHSVFRRRAESQHVQSNPMHSHQSAPPAMQESRAGEEGGRGRGTGVQEGWQAGGVARQAGSLVRQTSGRSSGRASPTESLSKSSDYYMASGSKRLSAMDKKKSKSTLSLKRGVSPLPNLPPPDLPPPIFEDGPTDITTPSYVA